jgi:F0F1-type ATP synthase assembly protein I
VVTSGTLSGGGSQPEKPGSGDWTRVVREAGPYLGLGTTLAGTVLGGLGLGYWIDRQFGTRPVFFLVGAALGVASAMLQFFRTVNRRP